MKPARLCQPLLFALLATAPALGQGASPSPPKQQGAKSGFVGVWESTFGKMVLEQDGDLIKGSYSYGGTSTIQGSASGDTFSFRYTERAAKGEGWFTLAEDGQSFSGKWRPDGGEWATWTGTRIKQSRKGPSFNGLFETSHGRIRFVRTGSTVQANYLYDGTPGTLSGTVAGDKLTFNWTEGGESKGTGTFTARPKGDGFDGSWTKAGGTEATPWGGQRVKPQAGVKWLMVLEAYWEESLEQTEYSFGAMLRAYLRRFPRVNIRHRRFGDLPDFERAFRGLSLLAEPVVLVIASHGEQGQLLAGKDRIGATTIGKALVQAPNVSLLHFSSCEMMVGKVPQQIRAQLPKGRTVPLSGYAVTVDWSASAVLEFLYFDLILTRSYSPAKAAALIKKDLRFAGDEGGGPLGPAKFRFVP